MSNIKSNELFEHVKKKVKKTKQNGKLIMGYENYGECIVRLLANIEKGGMKSLNKKEEELIKHHITGVNAEALNQGNIPQSGVTYKLYGEKENQSHQIFIPESDDLVVTVEPSIEDYCKSEINVSDVVFTIKRTHYGEMHNIDNELKIERMPVLETEETITVKGLHTVDKVTAKRLI